ncbi:MAG: glutamine synthetase family protein [Pseudomonadota bacterium]
MTAPMIEPDSDLHRHIARVFFDYPEIKTIELIFPDMNGVARGKLIPVEQANKMFGKARLPLSSYQLDIFSQDTAAAGVAIDAGDPDGAGQVIAFGPALWRDGDRAVALMTMETLDGAPNPLDPRQVLAGVLERFTERGLTPVVAPELEFYLMDAALGADGRGQPPLSPLDGERLAGAQIYRTSVYEPFADVLDEMSAAARALGAQADVALAEFGPGQFEINLEHTPDALSAADQTILLKHAIRGVARKHGMEGCFMAKPYGDQAGSGLHFHISVLDARARNVFSHDDPNAPNPALAGAIAALKNTMGGSTLAFAPHLNSFRRLAPGTYAPVIAAWGLDNRGVALRVPATTGLDARLEHRVAGADANPYLALALILQAILEGIDAEGDPGTPIIGEADETQGEMLPTEWPAAIRAFEGSDFVARTTGTEFQRVYALMKHQEVEMLRARVTDVEFEVYLRAL